jgi:hypothetical protein
MEMTEDIEWTIKQVEAGVKYLNACLVQARRLYRQGKGLQNRKVTSRREVRRVRAFRDSVRDFMSRHPDILAHVSQDMAEMALKFVENRVRFYERKIEKGELSGPDKQAIGGSLLELLDASHGLVKQERGKGFSALQNLHRQISRWIPPTADLKTTKRG